MGLFEAPCVLRSESKYLKRYTSAHSGCRLWSRKGCHGLAFFSVTTMVGRGVIRWAFHSKNILFEFTFLFASCPRETVSAYCAGRDFRSSAYTEVVQLGRCYIAEQFSIPAFSSGTSGLNPPAPLHKQ